MRIITKVTAIIAFLFFCQVSYCQSLTDTIQSIFQDSEISIEDDEASIDSLILRFDSGNIDSTGIPAARLYGYIWENQLVNPYQKRVADMPDTVCIDFSQYCHPNSNVVTSDFGFRKGWRF
ncbi:MAG: hypothetical protein LBN37_03765, partial [Bacteroidales bacterium]|nr:hypothetical protein [Bacteroidales bacterium]